MGNPPSTGHPREDYGCRCIAEPYYAHVQESLSHVLKDISALASRWEDLDFVLHFHGRTGTAVTLSQTGHLSEIVNHWAYDLERLKAWNNDIIKAARK